MIEKSLSAQSSQTLSGAFIDTKGGVRMRDCYGHNKSTQKIMHIELQEGLVFSQYESLTKQVVAP